MDRANKIRRAWRSNFTRSLNNLNELLANDPINIAEVKVAFQLLKDKVTGLEDIDQKCFDLLIDADVDESDLIAESTAADEYKTKYIRAASQVSAITNDINSRTTEICHESEVGQNKKHSYNLPKIEIKKFSGEIKDWLKFWSQFKKIHEDSDLANEDKFQYLIQAMVPDSRASDLVNSFPPTGDNYEKVISSLKNRFGKDDMLVEVYVRELLRLVLKNTVKSNENTQLATLFDKLESHMRALDTLGVTSDKCAAMLYPLVESSLPEDLLRAWQRYGGIVEVIPKDRLTKLMEFLAAEVDNEQRITMAVNGFDFNNENEKRKKSKANISYTAVVPTAAGLLTTKSNRSTECIFCSKNHESTDCEMARKMTLEDRQSKVKQNNVCFRCLKPGHGCKKCKVQLKCGWCSRRHVLLMCRDVMTTSLPLSQSSSITEREANLANISSSPEVFLQTLRIKLRGNGRETTVRAIIDTGSQRSYILKKAALESGYEFDSQQEIVHSLFGGVKSTPRKHNCYLIHLCSLDGSYACNFRVLDQDVICSDIPNVTYGPWIVDLRKMNISLTDVIDNNEPISVLIGADVAGKLLTGRHHILPSGLTAVETKLGWTLMGRKIGGSVNKPNTVLTITSMFIQEANISDLWSLDIIGITDPIQKKTTDLRQLEVERNFRETVITNHEGRYEVLLPWTDGHPTLTSNRDLSEKRLHALTKKLKAQELFDDYDRVLEEWLAEGIIEKVSCDNTTSRDHYLPHRHVVKENSTTKLRPVFDASARSKDSPSLNQCLEKGTNLIELVPSALLRFRRAEIGVSSDIRKAFLQISIAPKDRDYLRFLWWNKNSPGQLQIYRHTRVVFGVSCSPFMLGATIDLHLRRRLQEAPDENKWIIRQLLESFYVDNCVTSVDSKEKLQSFITGATNVMAMGYFDLRGWEFSRQKNSDTQTMILGVKWDKTKDELMLNMTSCLEPVQSIITKRTILSAAHKIFDPIGFACSVLLCPKLLLQKTWSDNLDWDTEVSEDIKNSFMEWMKQLNFLTDLKIPRWLVGNPCQAGLSFHVFCDASKTAYAAVIYARTETEDGVQIILVQAKSRVAPKKKKTEPQIQDPTIPRLELTAATVGARLLHSTLRALQYEEASVQFWSDSTTVLAWIERDAEWNTFVWNRVREIRQLTKSKLWRYVPGHLNPADLPSRGCNAKQLAESRWWEGPEWLKNAPDFWPTAEPPIIEAEDTLIRLAQRESFIGINDTRINCLNCFVDDRGIIRLKTPISTRDDQFGFRYPVVLDPRHPIVEKLIMEKHVKLDHAGLLIMMCSIREYYWILRCRQTVRAVIRKCIICKRHKSDHLQSPPTVLPENRVKDGEIFEVIGVDFAGPLFIKENRKAWICLFSCAIYRAIHLELVTSLSTEAFLEAFRRFVARRGRPRIVYSDNGKNFVGTCNALRNIDWTKITEYSTASRIEWYFNPPSAPWWGGWWERLIRLVKDLLKRILGKACLFYEEMNTILCDCEAIVNSRPLTYLSEDSNEPVPLTPAMFLQEIKQVGVPDLDTINASSMRRRCRYKCKLKETLRRRFRSEYLGQLSKRINNKSKKPVVQVGDIVLIGDDNKKRIDWPLARIEEVIPGKDGHVRLLRLRTSTTELLRPVQRIYPLEVAVAEKPASSLV